jgi:hypothetical protein
MCFSAPISFGVGGGLLLMAGISFGMAREEDRIIAGIPLLFGIQQAIEGVQWLCLARGAPCQSAGWGYLFIALILWPVFMPAMAFFLDRRRRKVAKWFVFSGVSVACYFAGLLLTQPLVIRETSGSIWYFFGFPHHRWVMVAYLASILAPSCLSAIPIFRWYGFSISILAYVSWKLYVTSFVSVWCFFAAAVSAMFFFYLLKMKMTSGPAKSPATA